MNTNFHERRISSTVVIIRKIYFTLLFLGVLGLVYLASGVSHVYGGKDIPGYLIFCLIVSIKYYGLRFRRTWVVPLILYASALGIIRILFTGVNAENGVIMVIGVPVFFMMVLFYAYQIYFFSRTDVNRFFGRKGLIFF